MITFQPTEITHKTAFHFDAVAAVYFLSDNLDKAKKLFFFILSHPTYI